MRLKEIVTRIINYFGFGLVRMSSILDSNLYREDLENYIRKFEIFSALQTETKHAKVLVACKKSRSQIGADIFALNKLNFKKNGYFIECGAGDGVHLSNSLLLEEEFGWTGILVEPNKHFHENLAKARKSTLDKRLLSSKSGQFVEFTEFHIGELSGVTNLLDQSFERVRDKYLVESVSLQDLLANQNAPKEIDYFSLDVEGYELEILKDFDFSTHIFRTLSIEHNFLETREQIFDLLTANDYYRVHEDISGFDDFYVHRTIF